MIAYDKAKLARMFKCSVKTFEQNLEGVQERIKYSYERPLGNITEEDIHTYFRILTDSTFTDNPTIPNITEKLLNGLYWVAHLRSKYLEKGMKEGEDLSKMKIRHKLGL